MFSFLVKKKTWNSWSKEENAAIKKAFACHLAQRKQPMHHDVLLALKHFPILQKRGVLKIKNKVRNEITLLKVIMLVDFFIVIYVVTFEYKPTSCSQIYMT